MIEDGCDWDTALRQFFGIFKHCCRALLQRDSMVRSTLKRMIMVQGRSPVDSMVHPSCDTQVWLLAFDLAYGWTYAIDFSGFANDETSITASK